MECRQLLAGDLLITEFMAANDTTFLDQDGSSSDWIEVHNNTPAPASLDGWYLTDNADTLDKWRFPDVAVPPDGYLVVFASGKDRVLVADELHTNFKLSADGEYVALVSPAEVVVSEFGPDGSDYPAQSGNISYGVPADGGAPGYLASPTPGAPNTMKRSVSVEFDQPSGVFQDPFSLTLTVDSPAATIHFTIDGREPTAESPVYTDPIAISSTTHVQAIAVAPGSSASTPTSAWYVTVDADLHAFSSDLSIVMLDNFLKGRPKSNSFQFNGMALFEPDTNSGRTSLLSVPTVVTRSGLRMRGSSTGSQPKSGYAFEAWDDHNDDKAIPLLGMPSSSDWVLYAPYVIDRSMLRNPFIYELSNQMGRYAVRTRFVEVFHNMDGGDVSSEDYMGVYVLMEKIKRGPDRVDIQELEPQHDHEPEITGGWMLKTDRSPLDESGFSAAGRQILYVDPKEVDVTDVQADWIRNHFDEMEAALTDTNPETGYAQYIDVDSWIDHHILNILPMNADGLWLSTHFYKDRGGKIEFGPIWDFDRSMECANITFDDNPSMWRGKFEYSWWKDLFEDPNFMQKWIDRWFELRQNVFSEANIAAILDSMAAEITEAQVRNFERWPVSRARDETARTAYQVRALDGTWEGEVAQMKAWLFERLGWIDSQFLPRPTIRPGAGHVPLGQQITMSAGSIPVYFSTDGSDPRLPGGGISPNARRYNEWAPPVFSEDVSVVARAMVNDQWSAAVESQFRKATMPDDASRLAVTEINANPYAPTDAELAVQPGLERRDFEFIELVNRGAHTIDLTEVALVDGVEFAFGGGTVASLAPGQYVLVVANQEAFAIRYGTERPVVGEFADGGLDNSGRQITLVDRYEIIIQDFEYGRTGRWPERADGTGSTLDVINTAGDYNNADNWRASSQYGGSPGFAGAEPLADVLFNEVLRRGEDTDPDLIELYNTTAHTVDLSGWYLSDDRDAFQKFTFPSGTTIGAGEYLVLSSAQVDFDLRDTCGDVWLLEADASGRPLRFVDHVAFDATDVGVSLGRWPNGDPAGILVPMTRTSFGAANFGPVTGTVVISEVYYNPSPLPSFSQDFSGGTDDGFRWELGNWAVRGGRYEVTPGAEGDSISVIPGLDALASHLSISATVNVPSVTNFKKNAALIFDYRGPTDFKFVSLHANAFKWKIGQRLASGWNFLVEKDRPSEEDTDIEVTVEIVGSVADLWVDDRFVVSHDFGTLLSDGLIGLGSKGGEVRFDNVKVEQLSDEQELEFIEIVSTTADAVDLEGWHLGGAVDLTFAPGTTLDAGAPLVVVGFDPSAADKEEPFRALLGVEGSVALAGPYEGSLHNGGETVRLLRPVALADENPGLVLVDQVAYDDQSPWPTAVNGQGKALSRGTALAFGNLAASWSALVPTPGTVRFAETGDLNFDGHVDVDDIAGFARVLADPSAHEVLFGAPATMNADVDMDGDVDFDDIDDFLVLLGGAISGATVQADTNLEVGCDRDSFAQRHLGEPHPRKHSYRLHLHRLSESLHRRRNRNRRRPDGDTRPASPQESWPNGRPRGQRSCNSRYEFSLPPRCRRPAPSWPKLQEIF